MKQLKKTLSAFMVDGYKTLSVKGLSLAVNPTVIGDTPNNQPSTLTFYVLDEYSRANSLVLEKQLKQAKLPSALTAVQTQGIHESSSMIFLKHRHAKTSVSPRLNRLIEACLDNPSLDIRLVPVTILWGRAPDKESSLLKLLMADEWRVPSITKQIFNIGVMGRDTFVQFYKPKSLQELIKQSSQEQLSQDTIAHAISNRLQGYLLKQRASILGPDLSDKRNISSTILNAPTVQEAIVATAAKTGKPIHDLKRGSWLYR